MNKEDIFTSTGVKFWAHPEALESYYQSTGRSIISTHVSPESRCSLNCPYCSVKKRKKQFRIELDVIKDYIEKLCTRGLRACIITGGGEPSLYPSINELIRWLAIDKKLSIGLITNGVFSHWINSWQFLSWVRVSINKFPDWKNKIYVPKYKNVQLGFSFVYTNESVKDFVEISEFVRSMFGDYVRVLPNCLLNDKDLLAKHNEIDYILTRLNDPLFFHQFKVHRAPLSAVCHQAYFRPYLSEVDGGLVFPCDSLVLSDNLEHFSRKYAICKPDRILDFMDKKISMRFDPFHDCKGCVFTDNIDMLNHFMWDHVFRTAPKDIPHVDFP